MLPSSLEFYVMKSSYYDDPNRLVRIGNFGYQVVEARLNGSAKVLLFIRAELAVGLKKGCYYRTPLAFLTFVPAINNKNDNFSFRIESIELSGLHSFKDSKNTIVRFNAKVEKSEFNELQLRGYKQRPVFSMKCEVMSDNTGMFRLLVVALDDLALQLDKLPDTCDVYFEGLVSMPRHIGRSNAILVSSVEVREEV